MTVVVRPGVWKGVPVAVKRIPIHTLPICSDNAAVRRQALKEAAIALALDHPHIVVSKHVLPTCGLWKSADCVHALKRCL